VRVRGNGYDVLFDSRLMEQCVLLAERREDGRRHLRFRRERDSLYEHGVEDREQRFERFHQRWFEKMELSQPLLDAIDRCPFVVECTRRCIAMPAARVRDQGVDLRDELPLERDETDRGNDRRPTMILQIRPETLTDPTALGRFLDHDLLHLEDMLDPEFGYRPDQRLPAPSPAALRRATERYRVLWDCTIDGRLHRRGRVGDDVAQARKREFEAAFPECRGDLDTAFQGWFEGPRPTHDKLIATAVSGQAGSSSGVCPLCSFACGELVHAEPPAPIRAALREDFPAWAPDDGACRQCLDLYAGAG